MIRKLLISVLPLAVLAVFTSEQMSDNGKAGKTGSPGELTCTDCHDNFSLNSGGGMISLLSPGMSSFSYTPGQTYNMSVTVTRAANSLFGIGIEALTASNNNGGTLNITDAASTTIKNATVSAVSRRNIVHTLNGGATAASKVFNFSWTAPAAGTGNVTIYFAGVAADGNGNENNDYVYASSQLITESTCTTAPGQPGSISGNATICSGTSLTYSVSPVSGATSYTWTLPSGWTGTSTSSSINATAGSTSGNISVIANNGCGSSQAASLPVTSNTNTLAATTSVVHVACNGGNNGSATVSPSGGTAGYSYSWTPSGGSGVTASNLIAGTYTVTVTDAAGCTKTAPATVTAPTQLIASSGINQTACSGSGVTIGGSPSGSGGTTTYTYIWTPSTGLSSSTIANPIATPPSTTNYTLTVTDAHLCQATSTVKVTVNPLPAQPGTINGNAIICNGTSATYSIPADSIATTYTWTLPSGWTGTSTSNSIQATAGVSSGTISVIANNSCGSSIARTLSVTSSTVRSISSAVNVSCYGGNNGSISVTPTGGTIPYSYQWSPSGGTVSSALNLSAGNYTVTISDLNGCTHTDSAVITEPTQLLANSGISQAVCEGDSILLGGNPSADGGIPGYAYTWTPVTGLSSSAVSNPYVKPLSTTNYTLSVTDANNCPATSIVTVTLNPLPVPVIADNNGTLQTSVASTYQWYLNGSPVFGANQFDYLPVQNGDYTVEVSDANGCSGMSAIYTITSVGINDVAGTTGISFYMNTISRQLSIHTPEILNNSEFTIIDISGRIVRQTVLKSGDTDIDLSDITVGVYTAIAGYGNNKSVKRIIIPK